MKVNRKVSVESAWAALVTGSWIAIYILVATMTTGCSFKVETGWHGETGRDDRTMTIEKKR